MTDKLRRIKRAEKGKARQRARRVAAVDRKIVGLLRAIEDGMYQASMKQRLAELETQKAELERSAPDETGDNVDVLLHPNVPELYRRKVEELEAALNHAPNAHEARELIRSMIDRIELHPRSTGEGLDAILYGDLAAILGACAAALEPGRNKRAGGSKGSQLSVVAGARNHLDLQLEQLLRG